MQHPRPTSRYQDGAHPIGSRVVEDLLKVAEPTFNDLVDPSKNAETMKMLLLDRQLLEIYAVRGRHITVYANRKAALGLK